MPSRTMVYLEPEQLRSLKKRAREEHISVAELIRRSVRQSLAGEPSAPVPAQDVYARIVGLGSSGETEIATDHDSRLAAVLTREHLR